MASRDVGAYVLRLLWWASCGVAVFISGFVGVFVYTVDVFDGAGVAFEWRCLGVTFAV